MAALVPKPTLLARVAVTLLPSTKVWDVDTVLLLPTTRELVAAAVKTLLLPNVPASLAAMLLSLPRLYEPEPVIMVGSPMAPELLPLTLLPVPMLIEEVPDADELIPIAMAFVFVADASVPIAIELLPEATAPSVESKPVVAPPIATDPIPVALVL